MPKQQTFWKVVCTPYVLKLINPCSYKNKGSVKTPLDNYITSFIPVTLLHTIQYYYRVFIICEITLKLMRYNKYLNYEILSLIFLNITSEQVVSESTENQIFIYIFCNYIYT